MKYLNDVKAKVIKNSIGTDTVYQSKNSGCFTITSYLDSYNIGIKFINTGYETFAHLGSVKSGYVKDPYVPSVYSVGISGNKYPISEGGRDTKDYGLWKGMLMRCYSESFKKKRPTYEGCKCSENFKSYEYFYEWCNKQVGFGVEGFELDKDLLIKGNKVYSESTCVFLPQEINTVLVKRESARGEHLIGVCWNKKDKAFRATVSKNKGHPEYLGSFKTELEAFKAYKEAKESFIKEQAEKWKSQIDERAYDALMNYEVDIDD